jgi:hypothetical protein
MNSVVFMIIYSADISYFYYIDSRFPFQDTVFYFSYNLFSYKPSRHWIDRHLGHKEYNRDKYPWLSLNLWKSVEGNSVARMSLG